MPFIKMPKSLGIWPCLFQMFCVNTVPNADISPGLSIDTPSAMFSLVEYSLSMNLHAGLYWFLRCSLSRSLVIAVSFKAKKGGSMLRLTFGAR